MSNFSSPYYPPRARWYAPLLSWGGRLRRGLALDRVRPPAGVPWLGLLGSLLVPGLGVYVRGPRMYGQLALGLCGGLLLIFMAELGRPAANFAFGLLLAAHASSINYLLAPSLAGFRFRYRLLFSLALLILLGTLLYLPAQNYVASRGVMPLRIKERVVIVRNVGNPSALRRGDWVAYSVKAGGDHNGYIEAGYGLGPILALPGDRVRFTPAALEVNGRPQPRRDHMPVSGVFVVPGMCWFVWHELAIGGHGYVAEATLVQTLLSMATITEPQLVGKPFQRWFWHRQFPL